MSNSLPKEALRQKCESACFFMLCALWVTLSFSLALASASLIFGLVFWVIAKALAPKKTFTFPRSIWIPLVAYLGICLLSLTWSDYPKESLRGLFKVLGHAVIFLMAFDIFSDQKRWRILGWLFFSWIFIITLDGFAQYFIGKDLLRNFSGIASDSGMRLTGSFKSYGLFATYLIMNIPLIAAGTIQTCRNKKNILRLCFLITLFGLLVLLYFTRSRGAILAIIASTTLLLLYKKKFLITGLFFVLISLSVFFFLPRSFVFHFDNQRKEQSVGERIELWKRALNVIQARPLTGSGINTYTKAHAAFDKTQSQRVKGYYAHNGYLQMGAEIGLIGLGCFLWFLGAWIAFCLKSLQTSSEVPHIFSLAILLGIFNFLLLASVDTIMHNPTVIQLFWFMLGAGLAYHKAFMPLISDSSRN